MYFYCIMYSFSFPFYFCSIFWDVGFYCFNNSIIFSFYFYYCGPGSTGVPLLSPLHSLSKNITIINPIMVRVLKSFNQLFKICFLSFYSSKFF